MRLEQFYILKMIAEHKSIRKASESLFLSPQSLSKSMIQLEQEWNTTLFERSRTGVTLTEKGETAYKMIVPIINQIEELNNYFHTSSVEAPNDIAHPLFISCCSVMELIAFGTINLIMKSYPDAIIQLDKKGSPSIKEQIITEPNPDKLPDIVIFNETNEKLEYLQKKISKNYYCYFMYEDTLCLQVPVNDPLASLDSIPLKTLVNLPMLLYTGNPTEPTTSEQILASWGYELKNVSRISNIDTTSQIALNQNKYCFVGYPSVEFRPLANVVYIPFERPISTNQLLLVKKKRKNRTLSDAFVNAMDESFEMKKLW